MSKQKYPQSSTSSNSDVAVRKGRENYHKSGKKLARRNRRQHEADERQAVYADLSINARVKLVKSRRGENKRELVKLQKILDAKKTAEKK